MNVLEVSSTWSRLVAAVLVSVVAGRFLWVSAAAAWTSEPGPPPATSAEPARSPSPIANAASSDAASSAPASEGKPLRVKLVITGGDDRSAVRVDGSPMGQSPLMTDFSCREGETVVIVLTNPKGKAETFLRPCAPGTIRVEP